MSIGGDSAVCCECGGSSGLLVSLLRCRSCERLFCQKCMQGGGCFDSDEDGLVTSFCRFCFRAIHGPRGLVKLRGSGKFSPSVSPRKSPLSRCNTEKLDHLTESPQFHSPQQNSNFRNFDDDDDGYGSMRDYFSPSGEFLHDTSDMETMSVSTSNEFHSARSVSSSPLQSPYININQGSASPPAGKSNLLDQGSPSYLKRSAADPEVSDGNSVDYLYDDLAVYPIENNQEKQQYVDFNNNELCLPPPAEDDGDEGETSFFGYDYDDDEVSVSGKVFTSSSFSGDLSQAKGKSNEAQKEVLWTTVNGHFRALVSQLLKAEGLPFGNDNGQHSWLEIVSSLAWQAGNFVRPDTSKGDSMDPGDYVKVKCIASGSPSDSAFVKGIVCTKNVKHKRMLSQHSNPRLLILGGALEYQKIPNELSSITSLLEQEVDHMKMALSKIEALRPNVLLVEKSVSSYAQEYLLAKKEITLVLNVKRSLLERIARCSGALIAPSIDTINMARIGHCEIFRVEKMDDECSSLNHPKKSSKTLMFFEGCPRHLGCTVLLRGASHSELKKVKDVIQYASFAAYHLSLETSFLADEGATLPSLPFGLPNSSNETCTKIEICDSIVSTSGTFYDNHVDIDHKGDEACTELVNESCEWTSSVTQLNKEISQSSFGQEEQKYSDGDDDFVDYLDLHAAYSKTKTVKTYRSAAAIYPCHSSDSVSGFVSEEPGHNDGFLLEQSVSGNRNLTNGMLYGSVEKKINHDANSRDELPREYFQSAENYQGILVSFSSTCIQKGTVCEHPQLFRIKFYGSFDKPLGRYLRDDLFDETFCCRHCKEPTEAHIRCYTHQQGSLTISIRRLTSEKLPGECDGRIWMWHRCLKCELKDGVPPAARRVVMSDAAWGLSFGKFLELSFSNHTTANRVASCGHSLQRDCLRFYGFGSMVAFFRYSSVDILSVHLPPSLLDFSCQSHQEWVRLEANEVSSKTDFLHAEVSDLLEAIDSNIAYLEDENLKTMLQRQIMELKDSLKMERNEYDVLLQQIAVENGKEFCAAVDILELNRLRRVLLLDCFEWDRRLYLLDSFSKGKDSPIKIDPAILKNVSNIHTQGYREDIFCASLGNALEETNSRQLTVSATPQNENLSEHNEEYNLDAQECNIIDNEGNIDQVSFNIVSKKCDNRDELPFDAEAKTTSLEKTVSDASILSEKIDFAWTGSGKLLTDQPKVVTETDSIKSSCVIGNPIYRKIRSPIRVHSFDSSVGFRKRVHGGYPTSLHLSSVKSFDSYRDVQSMVRDPTPSMRRAYSQSSPGVVQKFDVLNNHNPLYISSTSMMVSDGVRLLLPQTGPADVVIAVFDDEPTSIISYVLTSKEYNDYIKSSSDRLEDLHVLEKASHANVRAGYSALFGNHHSVTHLQSDGGSTEPRPFLGSPSDPKETHFRMSFDDESSFPADKVRFSVACYFAKHFDALRKTCCSSELDFVRSLSRCKRWNAQGGKSNVYFAKSLDERFIIKQVTKTEFDSFEEFAPEYFKYLKESISSGSPTSLAKIFGIYQVTVKHLKGGKEMKMDIMVMENLFCGRNISRVYDLKGSLRSRYNSDTSGNNKVLLDMNLLETLGTKPIFLGGRAKRRLERAVWNDTSFLASVDVMDYSLLVGIDEEHGELVIGIIDFIRQYTWDKHLESWVKASGILGGPKDASPTVISPMQYKKRFRKAMSKYFLTVPDLWTS